MEEVGAVFETSPLAAPVDETVTVMSSESHVHSILLMIDRIAVFLVLTAGGAYCHIQHAQCVQPNRNSNGFEAVVSDRRCDAKRAFAHHPSFFAKRTTGTKKDEARPFRYRCNRSRVLLLASVLVGSSYKRVKFREAAETCGSNNRGMEIP